MITKGEDTYVTLSEANEYLSGRLNTTAWDQSDDRTRESALITATRLLDDLRWTGFSLSDLQPLAFPRTGSYLDPRVGHLVNFSDGIPVRLSNATVELALHLLVNSGINNTGTTVSNLVVGGQTRLEAIRQPSVIPSSVMNMVSPMLVNGGSNSWWRAN